MLLKGATHVVIKTGEDLVWWGVVMLTPLFAHVAINNCCVSCERLFNPELKRRVVAALSNNAGYVIARSNEAKAIGIKMADAEFICGRT